MSDLWVDPNTYNSSDVAIGDNVVIADHNNIRKDIAQNAKVPSRFPYSFIDFYILTGYPAYFSNHKMLVGVSTTGTNLYFRYENPYDGTSYNNITLHDYSTFDGRTLSEINQVGYAVLGHYLYIMLFLNDDNSTDYNYIIEKYDLRDDTFVATVFSRGWSTTLLGNFSVACDGTFIYINCDGATDNAKQNYIKKYSIGASSLTYIETYIMPSTYIVDSQTLDFYGVNAVIKDTYIVCGYYKDSSNQTVLVFDKTGTLVLNVKTSDNTKCKHSIEGYVYSKGTNDTCWLKYGLNDYLESL